jgi:hypothetical protein
VIVHGEPYLGKSHGWKLRRTRDVGEKRETLEERRDKIRLYMSARTRILIAQVVNDVISAY